MPKSEEYQRYKSNTDCRCGRAKTTSSFNCPECQEKKRVNFKAWKKKATEEGKCGLCYKRPKAADFKICDQCREYTKERRLAHKLQAVALYGGKCMCCGQANHKMLQLDHVNNDGKHDRKSGLRTIFTHVARHGFRADLQLLCANCHHVKTYYGGCSAAEHYFDSSHPELMH